MTAFADRDVVIVRCGTLATTRGKVFASTDEEQIDLPFVLDYYFWLVSDPQGTLLVDTGFSVDEGTRRGRTFIGDPLQTLMAADIGPDWNGDVVLTHLHYDHTGHVGALPSARFHVSAAELSERESGGGRDAGLTASNDLVALNRARREGRVIPVAERTLLRPGIELISAPGHSPGQLMVRIATRGGYVLLTSDAAHFDEEYTDDRRFWSMTDPAAAEATYARIRRFRDRGDEVVTGHQEGLISYYTRRSGAGPFGSETAFIRPLNITR